MPLIVLGLQPGPRPAGAGRDERGSLFPVVTLLLTVGVLLWANVALAGDVAVWLGAPRWQGIVVTAVAGWLLTAWRPLRRTAPLLLSIALVAATAPLLQVAWAVGLGPIAAWERVATQAAFRFPPASPWVTTGRSLAAAPRRRAARLRRGAPPDRPGRRHAAGAHPRRHPPGRDRVDADSGPVRHAPRGGRAGARRGAAPALRGRQARARGARVGHGVGRDPAAALARPRRPARHRAGGRGRAPPRRADPPPLAQPHRLRRGRAAGGLRVGAGVGGVRGAAVTRSCSWAASPWSGSSSCRAPRSSPSPGAARSRRSCWWPGSPRSSRRAWRCASGWARSIRPGAGRSGAIRASGPVSSAARPSRASGRWIPGPSPCWPWAARGVRSDPPRSTRRLPAARRSRPPRASSASSCSRPSRRRSCAAPAARSWGAAIAYPALVGAPAGALVLWLGRGRAG